MARKERARILAPKVTSLAELIKIAQDGNFYINIDNLMLQRMLPHLKRLDALVGLTALKASICNQMLYFLAHFHLPKNSSFLYTAKNMLKEKVETTENTEKPVERDSEVVTGKKRNHKNLREDADKKLEEFIKICLSGEPPTKKARSECQTTTMSNGDYLNMVIYGAPGVGKSLVGEIIGQLFQSMRVFKTKNPKYAFRIVHAKDLIAQYVGQTAPQTLGVLEDSRGGVLMIDEAYRLGSGTKGHDSYAHQAVDTITGFLSENKDDICLILAGYEEDIRDRLFSLNRGLSRRFPWVHSISKYNPQDLMDILLGKISEANWELDFDREELLSLVREKENLFINQAGDMERLFNLTKVIHVSRTFSLPSSERRKITESDIRDALKGMENTSEKLVVKERKPPPGMYM